MSFRPLPALRQGTALDVICVGENSMDLLCLADEPVLADAKVRLQESRRLPGGQAATAAVGCSRLGLRAAYIGAIGDDVFGTAVEDALNAEGVEVTLVRRRDAPTRTAVVIVERSRGTRTVLEHRDPRLSIAADELDDAVFVRGRVLMIDGTDVPLAIRAARVARTAGCRVVADLDRAGEGTDELLSHVDVPIVTAGFLSAFTQAPSIGRALQELASRFGAAAAVATLGSEGAVAVHDGREIRVPARQVSVVDPTGAGDAFRAGFVAAWVLGGDAPDLRRLLEWGALAGALNCRAIGAHGGLPSRPEMEGLV